MASCATLIEPRPPTLLTSGMPTDDGLERSRDDDDDDSRGEEEEEELERGDRDSEEGGRTENDETSRHWASSASTSSRLGFRNIVSSAVAVSGIAAMDEKAARGRSRSGFLDLLPGGQQGFFTSPGAS